MSVAREVIASLREAGGYCVAASGDVLELNTARPNVKWVQWYLRSVDGIKTYYEVYNPHDEMLFVEFHSKGNISLLSNLHHEGMALLKGRYVPVGQWLYGAEVDVSGLKVEDALQNVRCVLDELYRVVEKEVNATGAGISNEIGDNRNQGPVKGACVPNGVTFDPFIGEKYAPNVPTAFGKRILVVGASHYCFFYDKTKGCNPDCKHYGKKHDVGENRLSKFGNKCEALTSAVIMAYRENDACRDGQGKAHSGWKRTFTRFTNEFIEEGRPVGRTPLNSEVFAHVVDVEYVQGAEGASDSDTNGVLLRADRNFEELKKTIKEMRSEVVVLWGPRVIGEVFRRLGEKDLLKDMLRVAIDGNEVTIVACRRHPASSGWRPGKLRGLLMEVGIKPLKRK